MSIKTMRMVNNPQYSKYLLSKYRRQSSWVLCRYGGYRVDCCHGWIKKSNGLCEREYTLHYYLVVKWYTDWDCIKYKNDDIQLKVNRIGYFIVCIIHTINVRSHFSVKHCECNDCRYNYMYSFYSVIAKYHYIMLSSLIVFWLLQCFNNKNAMNILSKINIHNGLLHFTDTSTPFPKSV